MTRAERYQTLCEHLVNTDLSTDTELHYESPFQLLVAVVLSAQCTDKRVNEVVPKLFQAFPGPEFFANATFDDVYPYIKRISYPNNKTRHLIGLGKKLIEEFDGEVPDNREALQSLPGVGRKTANVILTVLFGKPAMAVDTHVFRVSKRLGLVNQNVKSPFEVENKLIQNIPNDLVAKADQWMILHGRYTCVARKPQCDSCDCAHFCRFFQKKLLKGSLV